MLIWTKRAQGQGNPSGRMQTWINSPILPTYVGVHTVSTTVGLRDRVALSTLSSGGFMPYQIGDNITLQGEFQRNYTDTDPSTIVLTVYKDGVLANTYTYGTDASLVKSATGIYYVDYAVSTSGFYQWSITGTGNVIASAWDSFAINPNPV